MLPEISLNILDISQNSISAKATQIKIMVWVNTFKQQIKVQIKDNGTGMDAETVKRVTDPFYTTRTTRKVGLGIPFFKQEAECTGGSFSISSVLGQGTDIQAIFCTDHIDCMPLGNLNETVYSLIVMHPDIEFYYGYQVRQSFIWIRRKCGKCLGISLWIHRKFLPSSEIIWKKMNRILIECRITPGNSKEGSYEIIRRIESHSG